MARPSAGTYGHYSGKYNDVQFSRNTNVGNADRYTMVQYTGPAGEGRDFAPASTRRTTRRRQRHVPDGERLLRRQPALAADARIHASALARELGRAATRAPPT